MQAMSVIEVEQRRWTPTDWMGFHAGNVSDRNQAGAQRLTIWMGFHAGTFSTENQLNNLLITSCRHHSDIASLSIQSLPHFP
jgi:hypothetical protein